MRTAQAVVVEDSGATRSCRFRGVHLVDRPEDDRHGLLQQRSRRVRPTAVGTCSAQGGIVASARSSPAWHLLLAITCGCVSAEMAGQRAVPLVGGQLGAHRGERRAVLADPDGSDSVLPQPAIEHARGAVGLRLDDDVVETDRRSARLGAHEATIDGVARPRCQIDQRRPLVPSGQRGLERRRDTGNAGELVDELTTDVGQDGDGRRRRTRGGSWSSDLCRPSP